jgi:hypothetical protein
VEDWYSPFDSPLFSKTIIKFSASAFPSRNRQEGEFASEGERVQRDQNTRIVVIDASELGDILVTSNADWRQGVDNPEM